MKQVSFWSELAALDCHSEEFPYVVPASRDRLFSITVLLHTRQQSPCKPRPYAQCLISLERTLQKLVERSKKQ